MFLKSIEVQGFKSFANKMVFEFHKGITGIVGPNGSGKSNVADAVRWVLGEQSAKQLRGSKMEDVIFSGTESRKPLGFAYVAITLDNSDHQLAVEYDTVTVSRRVYRSGESEYKINGHNCRLKDVQELFFDTGIGKEGYSIIGQGQIDKILSGKPEERRELFDEAAGIAKYKKNRTVTEKSLEQERQNLERVTDILAELEKQVGPLEKQSAKAKEYLKLRDEEKDIDIHLFLYDYERLKKEQEENAEYYNLHCSLDELSEQAAAGFHHDFVYYFSANRENEDMERLYAKKNVFGWIDQIENSKLQEAIAQLPADKKLLLTLRYQYRKTQREVAQIMNIKQSSVCERENRILKEIKEFLK